MYTDTNCVQLIKAHSSAVTALNYTVSTGLLASAGRDNYIHLFNISMTPAQGNNIIRWYFIKFENFTYFVWR
jgi:WD40 repeat protein